MFFDPTLLYLATILPPIIMGIAIWKSDRFPEPTHLLVASFLLGAAIDIPLYLFIFIAEDLIAPLIGLDVYNKENLIAILSVAGTFFAYFSIIIVNFGDFSRFVKNQIPILENRLNDKVSKVKDKVLKIKLHEAVNCISKFCLAESKQMNDRSVVQLLRYYELEKELTKI